MNRQTFLEFWRGLSKHEKLALAERAKTSRPYLSQLAYGHRKAGAEVMARLKAADNRITDRMLRPDLY